MRSDQPVTTGIPTKPPTLVKVPAKQIEDEERQARQDAATKALQAAIRSGAFG